MKRILAFSLSLGLLATLYLFAENNSEDNIGRLEKKYGFSRSEDYNSRGDMYTKANIKVDVEYPGESIWKNKYGVKYEAYGRASAGFRWGSNGAYDVKADAYEEDGRDRGTYSGWLWKSKRAKYFDEMTGDDANDLVDWKENHVLSCLYRCYGKGKATRIVDEDDYYNDDEEEDHESLAVANLN